jgi:hypothetical protein
MNIYLILSYIIAIIIGFVICCLWQRRKTCNRKGSFNSSALISDTATNTLVRNFKNSLEEAFNPTSNATFTEAKLAYVTFADLKKYMCFIEDLSKKNGYASICNLGISMYYGRYPNTVSEFEIYNKNKTVENDALGHHTLVMVPTFNDGKKNVDFNPHFIDKDGPMPLENIREIKSQKRKDNTHTPAVQARGVFGAGSPTEEDDTNVNLNSFGLIPPNSNTGTSYPTP